MKSKIIAGLCLVILSINVLAQPKPQELIKYRQSAMMFMRWNISIIKQQVVVNPQTYKKQQVSAAAHAIAAVANTDIKVLFAPGTETGKGWKTTRAKHELFEQQDVVNKLLLTLREQANELARVSDSGNIGLIKTQFNNMFKTCKGCHKNYREKI